MYHPTIPKALRAKYSYLKTINPVKALYLDRVQICLPRGWLRGKIWQDFIAMLADVGAAWLCATRATGHVVSRIYGLTLRAAVMFFHFGEPLLEADFVDAFLTFPKFDPVWTRGLKFLNVFTWVLFACATEIKPFFISAAKHHAFRAKRKTASGTAAIAGDFFGSASEPFCKEF